MQNGNRQNQPWRIIGFLCFLGILDSLYLFLFQTKRVKTLVCPAFGEGCETVVTSPSAFAFGIPNSLIGIAGYGVLFVLSALGLTANKVRQRNLARSTLIASSIATAASIMATYEQAIRLRKWCFWCLASALISTLIFLLSITPFIDSHK